MTKYGDNLPEVELPYVFAGAPTGPLEWHAYVGEQPTFAEHRPDLMGANEPKIHLMHHVPASMRGPYKLDEDKPPLLGERLHQSGYAMCTATVNPDNKRALADNNGEPRLCKAKAINHTGLCSRHGGQLHPHDKKVIDWAKAPREVQWKFGKLDPSELDDEELSRGAIRKANGTFTKTNAISSEVHAEMVRRLFDRADEKMRTHLLDMVDVFATIAKGEVYEPADRLRAAENIWKWLRGGVPQKVEVSLDKPFQKIMTDIVDGVQGGSRSDSRAARGVDDAEEYIDAEVVADLYEPDEIIAETDDDGEDPLEPTNVQEETERLSDDWVPRKPVRHGPAGMPTTDRPEDPEAVAEWHKRNKAERDAAEQRRNDFIEQGKAHKKKMSKARAARMYFKNQGETDLPHGVPVDAVVNDDGSVDVNFHP